MKSNLAKRLVCTCLLMSQLLINSTVFAKSGGGAIAGGGGDATEERVDEIRIDLLKWIEKDGAKALILPDSMTYDVYVSKMKSILQSQEVVIGFIEKDDESNEELQVSVNGMPKTCRGFISKINNRPHILCKIARFKNMTDAEQYKLIHHEYAGLVSIENNDEAASDYQISGQITDYLSLQTVLKLAVKSNKDITSDRPNFKLIKSKYLGKRKYEVEFKLFNTNNVFQVLLENDTKNETLKKPQFVLRDGQFSFNLIINEQDWNTDYNPTLYNNVIVQYLDGSFERLPEIVHKLQDRRPLDKYERLAIENVVKFNLISDVKGEKKIEGFKLKTLDSLYEITIDPSQLDLSDYRGIILKDIDSGDDSAEEFLSDNVLELENYLRSVKVNRSIKWNESLRSNLYGCFSVPTMSSGPITGCVYEKKYVVPDKFYESNGWKYNRARFSITLIRKGDITDFRPASTTIRRD